MSELWDVYTIDRKLIGKTCIRGEQGKLADDAELKDVYGIRTFFGLSSNNEIKFNEEWYRGMLELETKAGVIDEYVKVAFYNHLIFRKK